MIYFCYHTLFKILKYWTSLFPWCFFTWFGLNITWIYINDDQKLKITKKKKNHGFSWIRRPHPLWFWLIKAWARQNQGGRGLLIHLKPWFFFFIIFNFWLLFMYIHVIFNPNQVNKPQGNKVIQYFKILNSVHGSPGTIN